MFKDLTDTHPCMSVITENLSWSSNSSTLVKESSERKVCLRETQRLIYGCTYAVTYVRGLRRSEYFYVRCCVCIAGGGERIASCTFSLKTHRLSLGSQLCQGSLCHCSLRGSWTSSPSTLSLSLSRPELLQQQRAAPEKMYNPQRTAGQFGGTANSWKGVFTGGTTGHNPRN